MDASYSISVASTSSSVDERCSATDDVDSLASSDVTDPETLSPRTRTASPLPPASIKSLRPSSIPPPSLCSSPIAPHDDAALLPSYNGSRKTNANNNLNDDDVKPPRLYFLHHRSLQPNSALDVASLLHPSDARLQGIYNHRKFLSVAESHGGRTGSHVPFVDHIKTSRNLSRGHLDIPRSSSGSGVIQLASAVDVMTHHHGITGPVSVPPGCLVCGDRASGKHYGVPSCDGCRGFFKRSVRRNMQYMCKADGRCVVDAARRNQCQACRFHKCLRMNMNRDAVQHERESRYIRYKRADNNTSFDAAQTADTKIVESTTEFSESHQFASMTSELRHSNGKRSAEMSIKDDRVTCSAPSDEEPEVSRRRLTPSDVEDGAATVVAARPTTADDALYTPRQRPSTPGYKLSIPATMAASNTFPTGSASLSSYHAAAVAAATARIMPAPPPSAFQLAALQGLYAASQHQQQQQHGRHSASHVAPHLRFSLFPDSPAGLLPEGSARLLLLCVRWAKSVPSFLQLPFRDQATLLEESWSELFILTAAQLTIPLELLGGSGSLPAEMQTDDANDLTTQLRTMRALISRLTSLQVDPTEYACLKAIVLFKPELHDLRDTQQVERSQDQAQSMLREHTLTMATRSRRPQTAGLNGLLPSSVTRLAEPRTASTPTTPSSAVVSAPVSDDLQRFGRLLLVLPLLKTVRPRALERAFFHGTSPMSSGAGQVPVERLLCEMFKNW